MQRVNECMVLITSSFVYPVCLKEILCMLGNYACLHCICHLLLFLKIIFFEKVFQNNTIRVSYSLNLYRRPSLSLGFLSGLIWFQTVCKNYHQSIPWSRLRSKLITGVIPISLLLLATGTVLRKAAIDRGVRLATGRYGCRYRGVTS